MVFHIKVKIEPILTLIKSERGGTCQQEVANVSHKEAEKTNFRNAQFLNAYIDVFHFILHEKSILGKSVIILNCHLIFLNTLKETKLLFSPWNKGNS